MGLLQQLLNLFAGTTDKKPDLRKFRRVLEKAMEDGILTEAEIDDLEALKKEYGLTDQVLQKFKRRAYSIAFQAAVEKAPYTPRKEKELQHIQNYLKLTESELKTYKQKLRRLRAFYNLKLGEMPTVEVPGLELPRGEQAHWSASVTMLDDRGLTDPLPAFETAIDTPPVFDTPVPELLVANQGTLVATNQRFLYKGEGKAFQIGYELVTGLALFNDGLRIEAEAGKSKWLRFNKRTDVELVAATLARALTRPKKDASTGPST